MTDTWQQTRLDRFSTVAERDIDLLLLEEFCVHPEYCQWFFSEVRRATGKAPLLLDNLECIAEHSVWSGQGETDLRVKLSGITQSGEHHSVLLLVENKVSAPLGTDQPERYQQRSGPEAELANANAVYTVLVAPRAYLNTGRSGSFDASVSYEHIRDFLRRTSEGQSGTRSRLQHRALMLEHAIAGHRRSRGQGIIHSQPTTDFFDDCYELIRTEFSETLSPLPNKLRARKSPGVSFRFDGKERLLSACRDKSKEVNIGLRFLERRVAVVFHHWPSYASVLADRFRNLLHDDMMVDSRGKTVHVAIEGLPVIETARACEPQLEELRTCLRRVVELQQWLEGNVDEIEGWLVEINAAAKTG